MEHELAYFTRPDGVRIAYGTAGDGPPLVIAPGPAVAPVEVQKSLVSLVRASWGMGSKVFADMPIPEATTEMQEDLARMARESATPEIAAATLEAMYGFDVTGDLGAITAPTLIIHRRSSRAFPPRHGREIAAGIPNARAVIIDGTTHFPPLPDDPNTVWVTNEILGFLADGAQVAPPTPARSFRTIVFTDVEGSTHLSMRLGDEAARDVLRRHETITRKVLATHGGTEIKAMGDGFMISFDSASSALDAATAMQRSIAARDDAPFRVRIGIDAGEPIEETTICLVPP